MIVRLKNNPIFQMSLGSKELFHSNFIAWLAFKYPKRIGNIFSKALSLKGDYEIYEDDKSKIEREKNKIDLKFNIRNNEGQVYKIVLENKVKSLPYLKQLTEYSAKFTKDNNVFFILLSLSNPVHLTNNEGKIIDDNSNTWHFLSYSKFVALLKEITISIDDDYHNRIIVDYISFIEDLIGIDNNCLIQETDTFDFHNNDTLRDLTSIRMHDLYLKKKYELLSQLIHLKLNEVVGQDLMEFGERVNWNSDKPSVYVTSGMTRSLGLSDIKYLVSPNLVLGIQIQGEHYRVIVEDNNSEIAQNIKEILKKDFWFKFDETTPEEDVFPKGEGFNKFKSNFFYRSIKLGTTKKVSEIIEKVVNDILLVNRNIYKVRQMLNKTE